MDWLPSQDSNLGWRIQSPLCYHYTTRHCIHENLRFLRGSAYFFRLVPKVGFEPTRELPLNSF